MNALQRDLKKLVPLVESLGKGSGVVRVLMWAQWSLSVLSSTSTSPLSSTVRAPSTM